MIPNSIGPFVLDKRKTTMKYGYYYHALLDVPFSKEKREIRVWLPEDYDFNNASKEYPVIYFADGQNLVNQNLCAFGCWKLDLVAHDILINHDQSFIAVGIDSPKDSFVRFNELNPPYPPERVKNKAKPYADKFVNYITDELMPLINQHFSVSKEKKWTAIAGSSMGGIMAFYASVLHKDTFGFSLDFSPAFFLYKKETWLNLLKEFNLSKDDGIKYYFYVGGEGFEKQFIASTKRTYQHLLSLGFDDSNVQLAIDLKESHNEDAWHKHLKDALLFWLN